jgi:threonine/homoserine/homoserine lactone efflux protein
VPLSSFVLATLALNLAPGPDMTYVAARSLGQGRRAGLISALGISFGCLFHVALAAAGVAVLLRGWPQAYAVVRMVGAAYLLYLGVSLIRHAQDRAALTATPADSDAAIFRQGVVTNVLNPKVGLFFLAFLPQFVDPSRGSAALQTMGLGAWFITSGTLVNFAVAWLAASVRSLLESRSGRAWFQRTSGAILIGLGVRLALVRSN